MLNEVQDEISIRLQDKEISYELSIPENWVFKFFIHINKFLMFNLFFNLINNAIKYNRRSGSIKITGALENNLYTISVTDTGLGIDAEAMPLIFNRFKKFRQSLQQDSFGLGLPIVKSIAAFHGITIEVVSEKEIGSSFKLI